MAHRSGDKRLATPPLNRGNSWESYDKIFKANALNFINYKYTVTSEENNFCYFSIPEL
jgi:hypothetical protein